MTLVSPVKTNELRALEIPPTPWGEIDNLRFGGIEYFFYPLLELDSFFTVTIGRRIIFFFFLQSFIFLLDSRFSFWYRVVDFWRFDTSFDGELWELWFK